MVRITVHLPFDSGLLLGVWECFSRRAVLRLHLIGAAEHAVRVWPVLNPDPDSAAGDHLPNNDDLPAAAVRDRGEKKAGDV